MQPLGGPVTALEFKICTSSRLQKSFGHQEVSAKGKLKKKDLADVAAVVVRFANDVPDLLKICAATAMANRERSTLLCLEALEHFVKTLENIEKASTLLKPRKTWKR